MMDSGVCRRLDLESCALGEWCLSPAAGGGRKKVDGRIDDRRADVSQQTDCWFAGPVWSVGWVGGLMGESRPAEAEVPKVQRSRRVWDAEMLNSECSICSNVHAGPQENGRAGSSVGPWACSGSWQMP